MRQLRILLSLAVVASLGALSACKPPPAPAVAPLGPGESPLKVLVVGDSFGLSVFVGLDRFGRASGQLDVRNAAMIGCPFGRGGRNRGAGIERPWPPECRSQDARLAAEVAQFQPDVVLLAGGLWDAADRLLEGTKRWTHIGEPRYDLYLASEFQHLSRLLGGSGAKVVWTTAPTWRPRYDPTIYMGPPPYAEGTPGRSLRYNWVLRRAVGSMPGVAILDLALWMAAFPGGDQSPQLRPDGVHLTIESSEMVATQWLGPWVVAVGRS